MAGVQKDYYDAIYEGTEPYIFISYSHADRRENDHFRLLVERFIQDGYRFWYDSSGIKGGDNWGNILHNHLVSCKVFVSLLSNQYFISKDCITELYVAFKENKEILPLECESITVEENRYHYDKVSANCQMISGNQMELLFNSNRIADCLRDETKREQRIQDIAAMPESEKLKQQKIIAESPEKAISKEIIRMEVDRMFTEKGILKEPDTEQKRFFFSKPEKMFSNAAVQDITRKVLELLKERKDELRTALFSLSFTGSRVTYKAAITTVKLVERMTKYYDFWTYNQNQRLNYFISDSAPLLRLMRCRAVRNEPFLSPDMIAAVQNFLAELDRLINCLEN